jgi:leucyl aminopeptidase (aminopeptidase T)
MAVARGAVARVIWIDFNAMPIQGAGDVVSAALQKADKVFRFTFATSHDKETARAYQEYGTTIFGCASPTREFFASEAARYPVEIVIAIANKVLQKVWSKPTATVRLTHRNGTDLRAEVRAEDWLGDVSNPDYKWDVPGLYPRNFPGAIVGVLPPAKGEGMVRYHAYAGGIGICNDLRLTFEDNKCVKIQGGPEADRLRSLIAGVPHANTLVEIMFGVHPKIRAEAPLDQKPVPAEAERRAGTVHVAIGTRPWWGHMMRQSPTKVNRHLDGFIAGPSLYLDDEPIIMDGQLQALKDPEVRDVASRYGEPDQLLRVVSAPAPRGFEQGD